jgi:hypothetical protein
LFKVFANKPDAVIAPVCVIAPFEVIDRLRPTDEAARIVAILLVTLTSLVPLFDNATEPVKSLLPL